jgi:hypothetical protein
VGNICARRASMRSTAAGSVVMRPLFGRKELVVGVAVRPGLTDFARRDDRMVRSAKVCGRVPVR